MNVLLTGSGGFIGAALLQHLGHSALQVRAVYHSWPPALSLPNAEPLTADLLDSAACEKVCAGQEVVIHLAGKAHVQGSVAEHTKHTLQLARTMAHAARAQGVATFVYISSTRARFPQHSAYAQAKRACEDLLLELQAQGAFNAVCLRLPLVYGPGMHGNLATLLRVLQRRVLPVFPASNQSFGMLGLQDCCRAIALSVDHPALAARSWEVDDGQAYSLDLLQQWVRQQLGLSPPWLALPPWAVKVGAGLADLSAPLTHTSLGLGTYRALYEEPYHLDTSFAALTGFTPQQNLQTELPALLKELAQ